MAGKSVLTYSPEFGRQVLQRISAGQSAEDLAEQMGRTPQTIRGWAESAEQNGIKAQEPALRERAAAFFNEMLASLYSWRESRYASQTSRELLKLFWIVAASHPGVTRRQIYRKVVMARTGANAEDAEALLVRAEQSFTMWPSDRALTFSDVVHYLAVSEFLAFDGRVGTRINMGRLVAGRIPQEL